MAAEKTQEKVEFDFEREFFERISRKKEYAKELIKTFGGEITLTQVLDALNIIKRY